MCARSPLSLLFVFVVSRVCPLTQFLEKVPKKSKYNVQNYAKEVVRHLKHGPIARNFKGPLPSCSSTQEWARNCVNPASDRLQPSARDSRNSLRTNLHTSVCLWLRAADSHQGPKASRYSQTVILIALIQVWEWDAPMTPSAFLPRATSPKYSVCWFRRKLRSDARESEEKEDSFRSNHPRIFGADRAKQRASVLCVMRHPDRLSFSIVFHFGTFEGLDSWQRRKMPKTDVANPHKHPHSTEWNWQSVQIFLLQLQRNRKSDRGKLCLRALNPWCPFPH